MKNKNLKKFTIIADTREKPDYRWNFAKSDICDGTIVDTVKLGDYTIKGLEDLIFLERKHSVSEWSSNIIEKRFFNLLEKVYYSNAKYKYILMSFPYIDILSFPFSLKVSPRIRSKIRITANFMKSVTASIPIKYGIPVVFFDFPEQAQDFALEYLKAIWRNENA